MRNNSIKNNILRLIKKSGILRPRDLASLGLPRTYLKRLSDEGLIKKIGRGLYTLEDSDMSESFELAEVAKKLRRLVDDELADRARIRWVAESDPYMEFFAEHRKVLN